MRYSTRTRYGLRFLINLGRRELGVFVQLADIAQQEEVSVKYLEQIVRALRPSGILRTARGAKGGYALARDPDHITLDQVFLHLEGTLSPVACLEQDRACPRQDICTARSLWHALDTHMRSFLRNMTLKELLGCGPDTMLSGLSEHDMVPRETAQSA